MNDMREIKFRGKRIDNNEWVYGHYFVSPLTDENSGTTPDKGWFFLSGEKRHCIEREGVVFVINPATLGQFTCVRDKNDKELYEGDKYRMSYTDTGGVRRTPEYKVIFRTDNGCFVGEQYPACKLEDGNNLYSIIPPSHFIEIIGDIYEV